MENKEILNLRSYIISLNINDYIKNKILAEFDDHINSVMNFYNKVLKNDEKTASLYINTIINKFRRNLDTYLYSSVNLEPYIEFIKNNISKTNEYSIRDDRLNEVYGFIKNNTLKDVFFKEILIYSSRDYNSLCADIQNISFYLGYKEPDEVNISYTDSDIPADIKNEIKVVE